MWDFYEGPATFADSDRQGTPIEQQIWYSCGENTLIYDIQTTCPIGQPTFENWLSEWQIYLSRTIGRGLFRTLGPHSVCLNSPNVLEISHKLA